MIRFLLSLITFLLIFGSKTSAQVNLPYYSGFDNTAEKAGWQIFRTGVNALANWSIASAGGFSPTSCIGHDYAPSTGAMLADDWYVSPGFLIPAGGSLDSVRYLFAGFSVPADDDTIGIFLLTGSNNPTLATSITKLVDFRGTLYQADGTYKLLNSIPLAASQEIAHIAIRYRNAQITSRWLTVRFDNIAISGSTTSENSPTEGLKLTVYPNPCTEQLHIYHGAEAGTLLLHDSVGKVIQQSRITQGQSESSLRVQNLASGFYYITIQQNDRSAVRVFMKQ